MTKIVLKLHIWFNKTSISKRLGFNLILKLLLVIPAWLNKDSDGTDVAVTDKTILANFVKFGNDLWDTVRFMSRIKRGNKKEWAN